MARTVAAQLVLVSLLAAACGATGTGSGSGALRVFAAVSLSGALEAYAGDAGLDAQFNFAGSQTLVRQIVEGAPVDVVATADEGSMRRLVGAGTVERPQVFARNRLAIAVRPGNPKRISSLADLTRGDVVVVLADASVPVGRYARDAFARAGVRAPAAVSLELDAEATIARVAAGEADATVAYATDVVAYDDRVDGLAIDPAHNVDASYLVAIARRTSRRAAAVAFVDGLTGAGGQRALRERGFLPPQ
jgi:molybdate transport system substrate-binding protein